MSLGYDREQNIVYLDDTATLRAYLYDKDEQPYGEDDLTSVEFLIQKPEGDISTAAGSIESDGHGQFTFTDTDEAGHYLAIAIFTTVADGERSVRCDFEVVDPTSPDTPSATWIVADQAWDKFEDCFDGEDEGPWLRDMTLNTFNKDKMESFIDEALTDINLQHPPTDLTLDSFVTDNGDGTFTASGNLPVLTQAMVVQIIRHLIRSYVEQPDPVGAQIAWHNRRDYLQRWQSVLQEEKEQKNRLLALFKRQFLGLGANKVLVASKAGRLIPAPLRTRNVGRGYWAALPVPLLIPEPTFLVVTGLVMIGHAAYMLKMQDREGLRDRVLPTQVGSRRVSRSLQRVRSYLSVSNSRERSESRLQNAQPQQGISVESLQRKPLRGLW